MGQPTNVQPCWAARLTAAHQDRYKKPLTKPTQKPLTKTDTKATPAYTSGMTAPSRDTTCSRGGVPYTSRCGQAWAASPHRRNSGACFTAPCAGRAGCVDSPQGNHRPARNLFGAPASLTVRAWKSLNCEKERPEEREDGRGSAIMPGGISSRQCTICTMPAAPSGRAAAAWPRAAQHSSRALSKRSCASLPATQPAITRRCDNQIKTHLAERGHGCREAQRPRQEGLLAVARGACTLGSKHSVALISIVVLVSSRQGYVQRSCAGQAMAVISAPPQPSAAPPKQGMPSARGMPAATHRCRASTRLQRQPGRRLPPLYR